MNLHAMDYADIVTRLRLVPIFQPLPPGDLEQVATTVQVVTYQPGETVFRQGEAGAALYIVESGRVLQIGLDAQGREVIRRQAAPGDVLGRHALLLGVPQPTTATADAVTRLFVLPPQALSWLLGRHPPLRDALLRTPTASRLRTMPCFRALPDEAVRRLADAVMPLRVAAGETIAPPDALASALFFIDRGQVEIRSAGNKIHWLTAGGMFGGQSVTRATARTEVSLLVVPEAQLRFLLKAYPDLRHDLQTPDIVGRLRAVPLFADLTDGQLAALAGYVAWEFHPQGRLVTSQGEMGSAFYILDRGEAAARVVNEQGLEQVHTRFHPGDSFGHTALFLGDVRDASIEAVTDTFWLKLHQDDFERFLRRFPDVRPRLQLRQDIRQRMHSKHFNWQEEGESVYFYARRHGFYLIIRLLLPLALLPLVAGGLLGAANDATAAVGWPAVALFVLGLADLFLVFWILHDWRNDYLVVTNRRISHQEQTLLISETSHEAAVDQVQEVSIERGVVGNLLGFGEIVIQTAASVGKITFNYLAEPERAKEIIFRQVARMRAMRKGVSKGMIRRGLEDHVVSKLPHHAPERALPASGPVPAARPRRVGGGRLVPRLRTQEGSTVIWRKHWLNLLARTALPFLMTALTVAALAAVVTRFGPLAAEPEFRTPAILVLLLLALLALSWLLWSYEDWKNDIYVLTDDRIMDIEKKPLFFAEQKREANLSKVQNATSEVPGPLAYLFNYGDVTVQTAAESGAFTFHFVSRPRQVQNEIFRRIEQYRQRDAARQAETRQKELLEWFGEFNRLRDDGA